MTFAELLLFVVIGYLIFRALTPLQLKIEHNLKRWLMKNSAKKEKREIVDITPEKENDDGY